MKKYFVSDICHKVERINGDARFLLFGILTKEEFDEHIDEIRKALAERLCVDPIFISTVEFVDLGGGQVFVDVKYSKTPYCWNCSCLSCIEERYTMERPDEALCY